MKALRVIQTGERDFCVIGEWTGMDALVAARPKMIATLDEFRDKLEDLGGGLGVTLVLTPPVTTRSASSLMVQGGRVSVGG